MCICVVKSFEELQPAEELTEEEVEDEEEDDDDITSSESDSDEEDAPIPSMQPQPEMLSKLHWPKASLHC